MSTVERPVLSGVTILVVDDHHDSVQLLIAALEPFGALVLAAGSAPEARELLSATDVDIIVCDLGCPARTGSSSSDGCERARRVATSRRSR